MEYKVTALSRPGHNGVILPRPHKQHLLEGESVTLEIENIAEWGLEPYLKIEPMDDKPADEAETEPPVEETESVEPETDEAEAETEVTEPETPAKKSRKGK